MPKEKQDMIFKRIQKDKKEMSQNMEDHKLMKSIVSELHRRQEKGEWKLQGEKIG